MVWAELIRLRAMARRKIDAREIALVLGRPMASIKSKIRELGLLPRKASKWPRAARAGGLFQSGVVE